MRPLFDIGLDLQDNLDVYQELSEHEDVARKCKILDSLIKKYQDSITSLEKVLYICYNIYCICQINYIFKIFLSAQSQ